MKYSFALLFWLNKSKINKAGEAPIYARININGKRAEVAAGERIDPERWDTKTGSVKGNREDARTINAVLDRMKIKIKGIYNNLSEKNEIITPEPSKKSTSERKSRSIAC